MEGFLLVLHGGYQGLPDKTSELRLVLRSLTARLMPED
jgi:hypothetical protein